MGEEAPLLVAARDGDLDEVLRLLSVRGDPNVPDALGETPLFEATFSGNADMALALLTHSADPFHTSEEGSTAWDLAESVGLKGLGQLFQGLEVDESVEQAAFSVLSEANKAILEAARKGMKGSKQLRTPDLLKPALECCDRPEPALAQGASVVNGSPASVSGSTSDIDEIPLIGAVRSCDFGEVVRLLREGADPNAKDVSGLTALIGAAEVGNPDIVASLLLHSANLSTGVSGRTAMNSAVNLPTRTLLQLFRGDDVPAAAESATLDALRETRAAVVEELQTGRKATEPHGARPPALEAAAPRPGSEAAAAPRAAAPPQDALASVPTTAAPKGSLVLAAVQEGELQPLLSLLAARADPNSADATGETPLFEAVVMGSMDIVAALLLHDADPTKRSPDDVTPLDLASDVPMKALLELFQSAEVETVARGAMLSKLSVDLGQRVLQHLCAPGRGHRHAPRAAEPAVAVPQVQEPTLPQGGDQQLALMVQKSDVPGVLQPLQEGVSANIQDATGETPLFEDVSSSKVDLATAPLFGRAEERGQQEAHGKRGASLGEELPLMVAVRNTNLQEVFRLIKEGAVVNASDGMGETALFEAVCVGHPDMVATLLVHSAEPSQQSHTGMVAKDIAPGPEIATLLDMFSSVDVKDEDKKLALEALSKDMRNAVTRRTDSSSYFSLLPSSKDRANTEETLAAATKHGDLQLVCELLAARADPNRCDGMGETPLFGAAARGHCDLVAELLLHGADPCRASLKGSVARNFANAAVDGLLDLWQGVSVHSGILNLGALACLNDPVRKRVTRHIQDRMAEEAVLDLPLERTAHGLHAPAAPAVGQIAPRLSTREVDPPAWSQSSSHALRSGHPGGGHPQEKRAGSREVLGTEQPVAALPAMTSLAEGQERLARMLEEERRAREAAEARLAALEARLAAAEVQLAREPSRVQEGLHPNIAAIAGPEASVTANTSLAKIEGMEPPDAGPRQVEGARILSAGPQQRYEVVHGPFVATRFEPSRAARLVARLLHGAVVHLGEWDASNTWRKILCGPAGTNAEGSWVPIAHAVWGSLLRPLDMATVEPPATEDWRCVVGAVSTSSATDDAEPSKEELSEARLLLSALASPGGGPRPVGEARPGTEALLAIFRGDAGALDGEGREALAHLDPGTVREVLVAALQHLRDSGVPVEVRLKGDE